MALQTGWFVVITTLWTVFFVLEGFDFGVEMVMPFLAGDDADRRALRSTTGPFWDGNEVWLVVVGGAMFAAFPDWYATMFSAYYLPLFAVLVALIVRATGLEYRNKAESERARRRWDRLLTVSCIVVPFLLGVAFGGLLGGLPIDAQKEFTGSFTDLVQPYALLTGLVFVALCAMQGLAFVRIRTTGDLAAEAAHHLRHVSLVAFVLVVVFSEWTLAVSSGGVIPGPGAWLAMTAAGSTVWLAQSPRHDGWAFATSSATIAFTVIGFFGELHPDLMVSTTNVAYSITTADSSSSYALTLITIIAVVMVPVVAIYTAWNYWVFRQRIGGAPVSGGDQDSSSTGTAGGPNRA